ncbi:HAD-IA family hydrolase [Pendulispora rubella]|uniref:HAD-IA family hydrolase n=1 Tax=Pendulispora rubella TaxID=2741070 RepID=A0ABZ2KYE1_9BACT
MSKPTLLFDLDGTLVDTDPLHFQAFCAMLGECGGPEIDLAYYQKHVMGGGVRDIFARLMPQHTYAEHVGFAGRKEAIFREMVATPPSGGGIGQNPKHGRGGAAGGAVTAAVTGSILQPTRGLLTLLDWAKSQAIRCGLVTNAPRENAGLMLEVLGIAQYFETMVIAEELAHTKPHPLPYLTGLKELGVSADTALAFEDSRSGVRAATAAGIRTVGIRSSLSDQALRDAGAAYAVTDFEDPVLWAELRAAASGYRQVRETSVQNGG